MWFKAKPLAFYQEDTGNTFSSESKYILNKNLKLKYLHFIPKNTDPWFSCSNFTVSRQNPRVCKFTFTADRYVEKVFGKYVF